MLLSYENYSTKLSDPLLGLQVCELVSTFNPRISYPLQDQHGLSFLLSSVQLYSSQVLVATGPACSGTDVQKIQS